MNSNLNIGLIGHGHLGKAISKKLQDNTSLDLRISEGRGKNIEMLNGLDTLLLTIRPNQINELVDEIKEKVEKQTLIISFMAGVPLEYLKEHFKEKVERAMIDLNLRQIITTQRDRNEALESISEHEIINTNEEENIDGFTVLVGCLPGVSAWHFENNKNAKNWLYAYTEYIESKIGVSKEVTLEIINEISKCHDFSRKISQVATKGGITEAMIIALSNNADISYEDLYLAGKSRIDELKKVFI